MIKAAFFFIISFIFLGQTTFLHKISLYGIQPDLVLIVVLYFAITSEEDRGVLIGAGLGLLQDILSGGILGLNFFTKGVIAFLVGGLRNNIVIDNVLSRITIIFFSAVLEGLLCLGIFKVLFHQEAIFVMFSGIVLGRAVYCSVVGVFLMAFFDSIFSKGLRRDSLRGYGYRKKKN